MKKNKKEKCEKIGGMALFQGLLLRNSKRDVVVERIDEKIKIDITQKKENTNTILQKIPIIRGIYLFVRLWLSCIPYIGISARRIAEDLLETNKEEEIEVTKIELIMGFGIAIILLFFFFTAIPNMLSLFVEPKFQNILQCLIQVISFLLYLVLLKRAPILQSMFEYHGAEHKVINAYENLGMKNLTIENVKKQTRFHKRCGGNFVIYFVILFLLLTLVLPSQNLIVKNMIQIIAVPFLLGISYEIFVMTSNCKGVFSFLCYPAMAIQWITTKEPSKEQIQIAIYCLMGCVNEKNEMKLTEYMEVQLKEYISDLSDFDKNDFFRIVARIKKITKEEVFLHLKEMTLEFEERIALDTLCHKLYIEHIPLQYILGRQAFYREEYEVNENVLIPRADSEILVEKAIEYIQKEQLKTMIDMCTGSGCIGISITKNSDISFCALVDVSKKALDVARRNVALYQLEKKVCVIQSDLFQEFMKIDNSDIKRYDLIVANPPYIRTDVIQTLDKKVQNEPILALDGGEDGLTIYRRIFEQAKNVLRKNGYLMLEIGYDQLEEITCFIKQDKSYELIESVKDFGGNDRVVICRFLQT